MIKNIMLERFKVQLFWEGHKNVRNRPYGFEIQNHEDDCANFCGLLRKAELYRAPKLCSETTVSKFLGGDYYYYLVLLNKELPFSGELPANSNKDHLKTWIHLIKASKSTQVFLEVQFGKSFHLSWLPIYDLIGEFSKVGPYKHGIIHTVDWCLFSPIKTKIKKNEKAPRLPGCPKYYKSDIK